MFYSMKTGGFYSDALHSYIPDDAIEISQDTYEDLKEKLSIGCVISIGDDGVPIALPDPLEGHGSDEMERVWRDDAISRTDYLAMPDYPITDDAKLEILEYRQKLRDWPSADEFPNKEFRPSAPSWLEFK